MKIDDISGEEFATISNEEQLQAFMEMMREYQASVTSERCNEFVELL